MRWEALFADLEAEFAAHNALDADAELRDRARREAATLRLVDRLAPARGSQVAVHVSGAVVRGRLVAAGSDWLLLAETASLEALIPLAAVGSVAGLGRWSATPGSEGRVGARLDLGYALRGIARDRAAVAVSLIDGTTTAGTIDRVGKDFIEVAEHPAGEPRRAAAVLSVRTVPHSAIVVVRTG
jgi:hypothetical protein